MLLLFEAALAYPPRPPGDSDVRARVPDPGFPEGIAVSGNKMYVSSPAQLGHSGDARIFAFDTNKGTLVKQYPIPTTNNAPTHGLVGMALDGSGNLYVADIHRGVVRLDLSSGQTETYAEIPDLPPCSAGLLDGDCSPTLSNRPPFPNDVVFDRDGNLYVSDSFQATVWKIPPPGPDDDGLPLDATPWFQDAALDRPVFGPNGIRLTPDGKQLCIAVTGPRGAIFCLAFPDPEGSLTVVRKYGGEGPDNMAFGQSGTLYVALAFASQIEAIPSLGSSEGTLYSGPARAPDGDVDWDAPAGVAFDNASGSLLVTNHALNTGILFERLFVVFDVFVNDKAHPLERPELLQVE